MTKHFLIVAALAILLLVSCGAPPAAPTATPAAPKATPTPATALSVEYQLIFDAAWQTVNEKYFDPTFGGKDWQAIGDE